MADQRKLSDEIQLRERLQALAASGLSQRELARELGVAPSTVNKWMRQDAPKDVRQGLGFSMQVPVEPIDLEALVARRKAQYDRKAQHERESALLDVKVKLDGPIGILHLGDPHVDDDGTDLSQLEADIRIATATPGMLVANVGDTTNNWVGRLAALYGQQSTSAAEAWALAEWMFELIGDKLLYVIGGNHDLWSGAGDPLKWIAAKGSYMPSQARIRLKFPNDRDIRINARHDFKGHSMYNPAHGVGKALLHGVRDHIAVCGHKHTSGYTVLKDPATGIIGHGIQVASYKIYDRYAKDHGFRDQHISPCAVTIVDPAARDEASLVHVFWNAAEAAEFLRWKRRKAA